MDIDLTLALITEEEYAVYREKDPKNPNLPSDQIVQAIHAASEIINSYCDRLFITPASQIQEIFDGGGTKNYWTRNGRIADTTPATDCKIYLWQSTSWVEQTAAVYPRTFDASSGRVYFNNGHCFYEGEDNWRLDYKYGWAQASIPADLKGICCAAVHRILMVSGGKEGLVTEAFGDASNTYNLNQVLGDKEKSLLNKYRRRFL